MAFLFATLLVALGASAWGGIQLGDWLVAHAPVAAPAPGQDGADGQQPVLDANGRPYVAQPPQPRIDGTLGVPDKPADREWAINTVSLFDSVSDPNVKLSRERISADQAREIAAASQQVPLPTGTSDVSTLDLQAPGTSTAVNGGAGQGQVQAGGYGSGQMMPAPPPRTPPRRPVLPAGRTRSSASWRIAPRRASSSAPRVPGPRATSTVRRTAPGARWPNARPVRSNAIAKLSTRHSGRVPRQRRPSGRLCLGRRSCDRRQAGNRYSGTDIWLCR